MKWVSSINLYLASRELMRCFVEITHTMLKRTLILYSIPIGWFAGASNITFPANIDETEPVLYVDLPLNETAVVGWGGVTTEEHNHVQVSLLSMLEIM
jgi:hypothetical protein